MTNITNIPTQDGYETALSQEMSSVATTFTVNTAPSYLPTTTNTYVVINPGKSNQEVIECTSYVAATKTFTVATRAMAMTLGVTATAQTHSAGSKVIISDSFKFWEDIQTAVNSKVDGVVQPFPSYTTAARDALSVSNGAQIYNTTTGEMNQYIAGAWNPVASGSSQPNSSTTVAGKVETATTAETIAGTDTGGTGANLMALPSDIAKNIQSATFIYGADAGGDDTYVVALTPVLAAYTTGQMLQMKVTTSNTGACTADFGPGAKSIKTTAGDDPSDGDVSGIVTLVYDGTNLVLQRAPIASTTRKGLAETATDAEAAAQTDTIRYVTPKQLGDLIWYDRSTDLFAFSDGLNVTGPSAINTYTEASCTGDTGAFTSNAAAGYISWYVPGTNAMFSATYAKTAKIEFSCWASHATGGDTNFGIVTTANDLKTASYGTTRKVMFNLHTTVSSNIVTCDGTTNTVTSLGLVPSATPVFYKFVYDVVGGSVLAYANGALVATVTLTLPTGATTYVIGAGTDGQQLLISPPNLKIKHAY